MAKIEAGDLMFPDLDGIVEGERQSVAKPGLIVRRTGTLFTDRRYVVGGLHCNGPRDDESPALLECAEALRERETPFSETWQARLDAFVAAHSSKPPSVPLQRHRTVDGVALKAQDEWWKRFGALENRFHRLLPEPFAPASQRRILEKTIECCTGASQVVEFAVGTDPAPSLLQKAIVAAGLPETTVRQFPVDRWRHGGPDLPAADVYVLYGVLNYLSSAEITALMTRLKQAAPRGARIVAIEPVCFPEQRPAAHDDATARSIATRVDTPALAAHRDGIVFSPGTRQTRGLLARRWWGELPSGPAPLQRPFVGDELARRLAQDFVLRSEAIVQAVIAHELGKELLLLADDAPGLAHRLAAELVPEVDELEAALLARDPLPDVSWYLSMLVAVA